MWKKLAVLLSISIFLIGCTKANVRAKEVVIEEKTFKGEEYMEKTISYEGDLIVNVGEDFKLGKMEDVRLNEEIEDSSILKNGEIVLDGEKLEGSYTSPVILIDRFNQLVASWNVNTPERTNIELFVQVRVEEKWSMWYSYGKWSSNKDSQSIKGQKDELGKMSIDTLEILQEKYGDALKYKIVLKREDKKVESPRVRSIYITLKTEKEDIEVLDENIKYLVDLDVPERSQMIIPEIGSVICSPTSVAMVLEYYGENMTTEEVAAGVRDNGANIYGNWSYNVSFGGIKGLDSYVARYSNVDGIKKKIAEGIPVIASIKTTSEDTIIGAPQTYPSGHLLVVRGFTEKDGEEYVIVNDPASKEVENVRREYKLSDFQTAWRNIVYIITKTKE